MKRLLFALSLGLVAGAATAETIVPAEWAKTFDITFSGYAGEETLTDFPALVRLNTSAIANFSYDDFLVKDANGVPSDLRFTDALGNALDYEIDTWNAEGESLVWVRVPTLTKTTKISAYYGKLNATAQANESTVWKDYLGVWHLTNLSDSGVNNLTMGQKGYSSADGLLGKAQDMTAKANGNRLQTPTGFYTASNASLANFTVSAWFYPRQDPANVRIFSTKNSYKDSTGFEVTSKTPYLYIRGGSDTNSNAGQAGCGDVYTFAPNLNEWVHIAVTYLTDAEGKTSAVYYLNGVKQDPSTSEKSMGVAAATQNKDLAFCNYGGNANGGATWQAMVDEPRYFVGKLSEDRATAEYATMAPGSTFASYGAAGAPVTDVVIVVTGAASEATQTGFTAAGAVSSLGGQASVAVEVEYGVDEDHLTRAPLATVTEPGQVSAAVTGLMPNTTYLWRVCAGEVTGDFADVTTLPGEATFGEVTVSSGMIDVTASVSLTGLAASEDGTVVELYVSTDPENWGEAKHVFTAVTTLEAATFTATATGLELGTEYAVAFKATGSYQGETYVTWTDPVTVTTGNRPAITDRGAVPSLVKNTIDFTAALELTGGQASVSLLTGASPESLTVTKTWENLTASTELTASIELPAVGVVYYQFVASSSFVPAGAAEPTVLSAETTVDQTGKVTWTGATDPATDNWRDLDNWDAKVLPTERKYIAVIPETAGDPVRARIPFSGNTVNNVSSAALVVGAGQTAVIDHQKWNGSIEWHFDAVRNAGALEIRGGANSSGNQTAIFDEDREGVINAEGASLRIIAPTTGARGHRAVYRINAGVQNDGLISLEHGEYGTTQGANNDATARLVVASEGGTLTNNGMIRFYTLGGQSNTGYAHLQFGNGSLEGQTYEFAGSGRIFLDMSGRSGTDETAYERAILVDGNGNKHQKLVNGAQHTIEGAGYIKDLAFDNYGLVRAFDRVRGPEEVVGPYPLQFRCFYATGFGSRLENMATGRMIAMETSGGILLGNAEYGSVFVNHGLLEARTGSKILIRPQASEVTNGKSVVPATVPLGGVIAGDGTLETSHPVVVKGAYTMNGTDYPAAVVKPGNLALNAQGEDDGLGASLPGILHFTDSVTFKAGTTLEIDGGRVAGGKKVDGIEVAGGVTIEEGAKLKIMTKMPGGTYPLITSTQPITGAFTVELAEGASKVKLSSRSVKTGSHEEMVADEEGVESPVTVDDYTYYLDGTFSGGFVLIVK